MKNEIIDVLNKLNFRCNGKLVQSDIPEYVDKILKNATIIVFYEKEILSGFIAFYNNDPANNNAFLTMLAVNPASQGNGIGKMLLQYSIDKLKKVGYKKFYLDVLKTNDKAINLYKQKNFYIIQESDTHYKMVIDL